MHDDLPASTHPVKETATELTITIKDEEKTVKNKFLLYDPYILSDDDPIIKECIGKTLQDFNGEPCSIKLKATLSLL